MEVFVGAFDCGEEETKHVGPCGTCGAIRVGAVSALFAPNAKKEVEGALRGGFSVL